MLADITNYFPITNPTLIFFVVMIIILFAPIIMGKLRIPHIIGMRASWWDSTASTSFSVMTPSSCSAT